VAPVRAPIDTIPAPPFPPHAEWVNVASLRMDKQLGRPVLVEFWDFCRANSLRTLPYMLEWHARYAETGLRVVSVHCSGFRPSAGTDAVRAAVARLGIAHPVLIDSSFALWADYGNEGWPARYLWDQQGMLTHYHYGEGAYVETELEIQRLLGLEHEPLAPLRAEDAPDAQLVAPSADRLEPPWSGPYAAGAAWAVLEGSGEITVNGERRAVENAGCHALIEHPRHTAGVLDLELDAGVRCFGVCFTPGLA
jgi:hypothetical protein